MLGAKKNLAECNLTSKAFKSKEVPLVLERKDFPVKGSTFRCWLKDGETFVEEYGWPQKLTAALAERQ